MKVFARFIEKNGFEYRLDTLLQFGDSWDLLGNIVLANPGSAAPINKAENITKKFWDKYRKNTQFNPNEWYEFKADSTMGYVEKLFSGFYTHKDTRTLNGVIQLFNCFNVKNANLEAAIKDIDKYDKTLAFGQNIESYFNDKPVYFGFSKAVLNNEKLKNIAKQIFDKTPQNLKPKNIYNADFNQNKFYHLGYINRGYKDDVLFNFVEFFRKQNQ